MPCPWEAPDRTPATNPPNAPVRSLSKDPAASSVRSPPAVHPTLLRRRTTSLLHGAEPSGDCSVRTYFSQFGDYVRIEQVLIHSNSSTGRRRKLRLSTIRSSKRGSGASSHSFKPGRAAFWSLSHSSIGTRTAVLTPRRVTTCGPFLTAASS